MTARRVTGYRHVCVVCVTPFLGRYLVC